MVERRESLYSAPQRRGHNACRAGSTGRQVRLGEGYAPGDQNTFGARIGVQSGQSGVNEMGPETCARKG